MIWLPLSAEIEPVEVAWNFNSDLVYESSSIWILENADVDFDHKKQKNENFRKRKYLHISSFLDNSK